MSGGIGPAGDISLPKEQPHVPDVSTAAVKTTGTSPTHQSFFTFRQLNALAVAIVISASGMVSAQEFAFVIFSIFYMYFISKIAFPRNSSNFDLEISGENSKMLTLYIFIGTVIGLFLPIAYIFEGIFEGDKEGIKAAAPHVFLLASQIFLEGLSFSARLSLPIRVLVPLFYNSMRILSIMEWMRSEISKEGLGFGGGKSRRLHVGRGLAVVNMVFWSFNLFGFLVPFYLPKAFKTYYSNSKIE